MAMHWGVKLGIGVLISGAVVGGIYLLSRPSAPAESPPDSLAGQNLPSIPAGSDTAVIATGITNVLGRAIGEVGQSYRAYNEQQAGIIRANMSSGGSSSAAQNAARQAKIEGARR